MINFRFLLLILVSQLSVSSALASEVTVAGFAFAGDFASAPKRFPYTFKLFQKLQEIQSPPSSISLIVNNRTKGIASSGYEFKPAENLVNLKQSDQALMTVLMLTGETVATDKFDSYYKTFVNLRGDALIFDYKSQLIVRSYPVSVVLFDATTEAPSEARLAAFVEDLVKREDGRGLITQYVRRLEGATPPKEGTKTVQVRYAEILPEALQLMPQALRTSPEAANTMLADSLGSILSAKVGISMLPNSIGHAVGGVMSMRLENGDDYKLKVGEGDYVFDVKLNKFAKIKTAESNVSVTHVFGAYASLKFSEPMLNTTFVETDLKNGETSVVPAGSATTDDFAAYQDAIRGLFLKLADAFDNPSSKWILTAASAKNIESQLVLARETLRKCK